MKKKLKECGVGNSNKDIWNKCNDEPIFRK